MDKLKVKKNKNVISFDFYTDLLALDRLYNICLLFNLENIYMSIYSIYNQKKDLYKIVVDNKLASQINITHRKHLQDIHIKLSVNNLPILIQLFADFDFEELNIWNCYDSWENYIEDIKSTPFFTFKLNKIINNKFYLDYLKYEENKVSIICDLTYESKGLQEKLISII